MLLPHDMYSVKKKYVSCYLPLDGKNQYGIRFVKIGANDVVYVRAKIA